MEKPEATYETCIYLGTERDSNEYRIGGTNGVVKAVALKMSTPDKQRGAQLIKDLVGVPWDPRGGRPADGQAAAGSDEKAPHKVDIPTEDGHQDGPEQDGGTSFRFGWRANVDVRACLHKTDFATHGYIGHCG